MLLSSFQVKALVVLGVLKVIIGSIIAILALVAQTTKNANEKIIFVTGILCVILGIYEIIAAVSQRIRPMTVFMVSSVFVFAFLLYLMISSFVGIAKIKNMVEQKNCTSTDKKCICPGVSIKVPCSYFQSKQFDVAIGASAGLFGSVTLFILVSFILMLPAVNQMRAQRQGSQLQLEDELNTQHENNQSVNPSLAPYFTTFTQTGKV